MLEQPFRKTLIVDDNPLMLHLLDKLLSAGGYEVYHASNGLEAIETMHEQQCDIVITDWHMPRMDGLELCRNLRQMELPNYVFIGILTTSDNSDDLIEALDSGADDFYRKPIVAGELLARLRAGKRFLALERQLRNQARLDPLTQAINRRSFDEFLTREWSHSERHSLNLACVMIDVDYFKTVNDRFGHLTGDRVLCEVARILREECRLPDYLCRYGGEEFCILLPNTDEAGAYLFAERCRMAIQRTPFYTPERDIYLTASFGVADRDLITCHPENLISHADQSLMWSKRQGRNRTYTYSRSQVEKQALLAVAVEFPNHHMNREGSGTSILSPVVNTANIF